jgi:hypothetical protein
VQGGLNQTFPLPRRFLDLASVVQNRFDLRITIAQLRDEQK